MKSTKDFRNHAGKAEPDGLKKAVKLDPIKKSGKDKYAIYGELDEDDDDDLFADYRKKESVLDYFDDEEEDADE